jgi:endoglucanase
MQFLEELCNSPGPSGFEKQPTRLVKEYVAPYADSIYHDKMGNLFFEKAGKKDGPTILVPGHVDEIGLIITSINGLAISPSHSWVAGSIKSCSGKGS